MDVKAMAITRVALVDLPLLVREILAATVRLESDMVVTAELSGSPHPVEALTAAGADVIFVGRGDGRLVSTCRSILLRRPLVKVVAIEDDARAANLYELRPATRSIGDPVPRNLLDAARAALAEPYDWHDR